MAKEVQSDILLFDAPLYPETECHRTFTYFNDDDHHNVHHFISSDGAENEANLFTSSINYGDDFELLNCDENYISCNGPLSNCRLFPTPTSHLPNTQQLDESLDLTHELSFNNYFPSSNTDESNLSDGGVSCANNLFIRGAEQKQTSPSSFVSTSPSFSSSSSPSDQDTMSQYELQCKSVKKITTKPTSRKRLKKEASMKYREKKKTIKQELFNRRTELKKKNEILEKRVDDINRRIDMYKILLADIIIKKSKL